MSCLNHVRLLLLTVLLAGLALAGTAPVERTKAQGAKVEQVKVEQITVRGTAENLEVEIRTSGAPVSPNTQAITGPDRIVVDFPGALPSSALRALKANRGPLKGVRSGLFFENPPITRVVLDLAQARAYRIVTEGNVTVIKLDAVSADGNNLPASAAKGAEGAEVRAEVSKEVRGDVRTDVRRGALVPTSNTAQGSFPPAAKPSVNVSYENGLLSIHSDKASLSQVLFEVHLKTQADIPIPSGAEQEKVVADLGPGSARDVLSALLNGSSYNFIFVGNENSLERVILTRRDPGTF